MEISAALAFKPALRSCTFAHFPRASEITAQFFTRPVSLSVFQIVLLIFNSAAWLHFRFPLQLTFDHRRHPAFRFPLSTFDFQPSTFNLQPSTFRCRLTALYFIPPLPLLSPHSTSRGLLFLSTASSLPKDAPSRVMGFRDLFLFYVVTGVSLRWIATAAGHGPSSLVIWFAAWLFLYIPLALSVIHLSRRYPAEGGFYVWTKLAFGEQAGFLSAWMYWVSNLPYFPAVLYFAASNVLFLHPALHQYAQEPAYFVAFSALILVGLTVLNILGLNLAKWAHNLGAIAMWISALIIIVLGFVA